MDQDALCECWQLLDAGNNEAAGRQFSKALASDPTNVDALIGLSKALARTGQLDQALDACESVLDLDPTNAEAHYGAGWLYRQLGDQEKAQFHALKAVEIAPTVARYHLLAAKNIRAKDMEATLRHLEAANRLEQGKLDKRSRWALIYYRVFAGFASSAARLLMVWAAMATLWSCLCSAQGRRWWFVIASIPFLATSAYSFAKRRYYRGVWLLSLCLLWSVLAYFLVGWVLSK